MSFWFGSKDGDLFRWIAQKFYDVVYPAGGTPASAVKIDLDTLEKVTDARWTDVCKQID